ncbi:alpha-L-fucosidase [Xanthomonas campestris pv. campestris]|uniref:alpha-L-fucosidase n=1 Tax=Xanthomonas campestris TaxID=339 RepID=UPI00049693A5|nr:alpha-L-fucosidase [Xanthomonas campestris]AKS15521.1 alpha-L-fucosidase [Xanthomonas campestris pv. campestris]MCC5046203.1 alpha-L-fucosidase [Xanthomonas campestris]MCC5050082.1 alpha-L-fucosidase [Xanthomonas campestris pv. aberrans]MCC5054508.1 alpha-L-fucosidase [Xanthomonas campestris]MCC5058813.1 alpha-L-fucosidase [Xanthomonas campestris]
MTTDSRLAAPSRRHAGAAPRTRMLALGLLLALPAATLSAAQSPTAPTATTLSPEVIDQQWLDATAQYAPERARLVREAQAGARKGPFRPDWAALKAYQSPAWYDNAKFGIFIHWGVFSVPAFGSEWYSRNMYLEGSKEFAHHVATYGPQASSGYKDLIPKFTAPKFDPTGWAKLFRESGARYVVPVAEHHDGFALYDSKLSDWTAMKMGPKRDLLGELSTAIRAQGLHFGLSSHRAEHNWFFDGGRKFDSDVNDPRYAALYGPAQVRLPGKDDADVANDWTPVSQAWLDDWLARTTELIDVYQPDLIYFDWWIAHPTFRSSLPTMLAYYYNKGAARTEADRGVVVNYKLGAFPEGAGTLDIERGQLTGIHPTHWQTDTSVSNASWGYIENDTYKSPTFIIHMLADVVAKNGNLMLNIGPRADGSIPDTERGILLSIGKWLKTNGGAIYDSKPWRVYGEGPTEVVGGTFQDVKTKPYTAEDFRFTTRDGALYAIELGWPADGKAVIRSLTAADGVRGVTLLANGKKVPFEQQADGLHLRLPAKPVGESAYVFRIDLAPSSTP